ncbi:LuxR C-terminal-related transcriptional regulator [Microvirga sp. GCM10011540]|uniref:LuxR C-terminal-related transcriptional regulator n=1 Tax=Microvirga sp. GCM10011540 TaxID=3317338 RepID=UPI00361A280E
MLSSINAPGQHVKTLLICKNSVIRAGITQMLADTCFLVSDEIVEYRSVPSVPADAAPLLFIIGESRSADELADIVSAVKARCSAARVVALADDLEPKELFRVYEAGLDGLCTTTISQAALVKVLELVTLGETFVPAGLALELLSQASRSRKHQPDDSAAAAPVRLLDTKAHKLSNREAEILRCLMEGAPNKIIARRLDVAEATVKVHVKTILRKIGAANRTQAAMWATGHLNAGLDEPLAPASERHQGL